MWRQRPAPIVGPQDVLGSVNPADRRRERGMAHEYCPRCGEGRIGAFRFCRSCKFDFDELDAASQPPAAARAGARPDATAPVPMPPPQSTPPKTLAARYGSGDAGGGPVRPAATTAVPVSSPASTRKIGSGRIAVGVAAAVVALGAVGAAMSGGRGTADASLAPVGATTTRPTNRPAATVVAAAPTLRSPAATPAPTPAPTPEPTPDPTPVATKAPSFVDAFQAAKKVRYRELFRNSEKYEYETIAFRGEIIQVLDDGSGTYTLRINVTKGDYGFWDDTVLVLYEGKRFLEDDIVAFYGTYTGPYTYESVMGGDITIPGFIVGDVKMRLSAG